MEIKKILENKRFRNTAFTIIEIFVVAGIIFAALMFLYGKVNKEADRVNGLNGKGVETETKTKKQNTDSNDYYIEINQKQNACIIYRYSKDKKTKNPYKVFSCSVGKNVKQGKYKTSETYTWLDINGSWHKYNTRFGENAWIQSAEYRDKYSYTLKKSSYNAIGSRQRDGKCIFLTAEDAAWIFSTCKAKTEISIIKGKKTDKLPLQFKERVKAEKYCGWDPTDPDTDNPHKKIQNGKMVNGASTVFVEKGDEPEYLANLLARNENGKNITGKIKYKIFDSSRVGTYKVKFTCRMNSGVDTTPPVVKCGKTLYTYEVKSLDKKDLNRKSNITEIEKMVRAGVSCNESNVQIKVFMSALPEELEKGKFPVVVKAQDDSGNVGGSQTTVEIKIEKSKKNKKYNPSEKLKNQQKKKTGQKVEETTKQKKEKKESQTVEKNSTTEKETTVKEAVTKKE